MNSTRWTALSPAALILLLAGCPADGVATTETTGDTTTDAATGTTTDATTANPTTSTTTTTTTDATTADPPTSTTTDATTADPPTSTTTDATTTADPTSDTDATTTADSTTDTNTDTGTDTGGPNCGDGNLDAGEECDDGDGDNTNECTNACTLATCKVDEHVVNGECIDCPPGTVNDAGDAPAGDDTSCDAVLCLADERVQNNVCVPCPPDTTNEAGDDASGPDTMCVDPCFAALGVHCDDFDQGYFKASNTDANDQFGYAVALSGDILAVGANREDSNATGVNGDQSNNSSSSSGAVYVFRRTNNTWAQEAYLKASNPGADDYFGDTVTLFGDTLAVGARLEDSNATGANGDQANNSAKDSGAVYVFRRTNNTWAQEAYLKASNTGANDWFGCTVSLSSDTLAIGANGEDSNVSGVNGDQLNNLAFSSGAVYVFRRTNNTWAQEAYLKASNTDANEWFGWSVTLAGDTLAVGAPTEDSNATGVNGDQANNSASTSGAVYVFRRSNATWAQEAYVKASNTDAGDFFGESVALSGDTLAVGASREDSKATGVNGDQSDDSVINSGAAYVFRRTNNAWAQEAYVKASNPKSAANFGWALALSGDTLAVGAHSDDSNATGVNGDQANKTATDSGAVYVLRRSNNAWAQKAYLKASNTGASDLFGWAVALSGDTLAVGAYREDSNATGIDGDQSNNTASDSGAVYVRKIAP